MQVQYTDVPRGPFSGQESEGAISVQFSANQSIRGVLEDAGHKIVWSNGTFWTKQANAVAESYTTIRIAHTGRQGTNDVHLVFDQAVEVKGVNGVSPDNPGATYTIESDDNRIDISDMNFPPPKDNTTTVRVKGQTKKKPVLDKENSYWTIDGDKSAPL